MDLNHRPPGYEPGELNLCSTPQSAQRELNPRLLHGKQMGYHYTMGAIDLLSCQRSVSRLYAAREHRARIELASPRYDGGILPLDEQCFVVMLLSGIRGTRTLTTVVKSHVCCR